MWSSSARIERLSLGLELDMWQNSAASFLTLQSFRFASATRGSVLLFDAVSFVPTVAAFFRLLPSKMGCNSVGCDWRHEQVS